MSTDKNKNYITRDQNLLIKKIISKTELNGPGEKDKFFDCLDKNY